MLCVQQNLRKINRKILNIAKLSDYSVSLLFLNKRPYKHHSQSVVILIDEYNTPLYAGYNKGYADISIIDRRATNSSKISIILIERISCFVDIPILIC